MPINPHHRFQVGKNGSISINILAPKIENLVIEGAGTRGPVGAGAIETLENKGVLANVKRVAGSSAGASIATLVALGYKAKEIKDYVDTFNFNELKDVAPPKITSNAKKIFHGVYNVFSSKHGIYKGKKLLEEIRKLIQEKVKRTLTQHIFDKKMMRELKEIGLIKKVELGNIQLNNTITFNHLNFLAKHYPQLGFKTLFITGTNATKKRLEIFSHETEPDMEIALAVRISMSIPWVFKQVKFKNNFYMDGGCLNNFPMNIFDDEKYKPQGKEHIGDKGQNLCTLGIKIDTKSEMEQILWQRPKPIQSKLKKLGHKIKGGAKNLFVGVNYIKASQQNSDETYDKYSHRVIQGFDENVGFADFNLDDTKKKALYESGKKAALDWFEIHTGEVVQRQRFNTLQEMSDEVLKEYHYCLRNHSANDMFVQLGKTAEQIEQAKTNLFTRATQKLQSRNLSPFVFFHKPVLKQAKKEEHSVTATISNKV